MYFLHVTNITCFIRIVAIMRGNIESMPLRGGNVEKYDISFAELPRVREKRSGEKK